MNKVGIEIELLKEEIKIPHGLLDSP